jgi:hypothetical protein
MKRYLLRRIRKIAKAAISFYISVCPSVHPRGTTRLPMSGFSPNFIFQYFSKICQENSSLLKYDKNKWYFTWRQMYILDHTFLNSV